MVYADETGRLKKWNVNRNPRDPAFHLDPADLAQLEGTVRTGRPAIAPAVDQCISVSLRMLARLLKRLKHVRLANGARIHIPWGDAALRHLESAPVLCDRVELVFSPPGAQASHRDCPGP